eukprot:930398_1
MSRPKPQPGGGPILDTSIGVDDKTGNGDDGPISAIVQHLLEKKAAKRRAKSTKAAEKKKKASKKKAEKKKAGGNKNEGDKTASARSGKKKRNPKSLFSSAIFRCMMIIYLPTYRITLGLHTTKRR